MVRKQVREVPVIKGRFRVDAGIVLAARDTSCAPVVPASATTRPSEGRCTMRSQTATGF